jgi:hypothetical protein
VLSARSAYYKARPLGSADIYGRYKCTGGGAEHVWNMSTGVSHPTAESASEMERRTFEFRNVFPCRLNSPVRVKDVTVMCELHNVQGSWFVKADNK